MLEFLLVFLGMLIIGYIIIRFFPFIGWLFFGIGFVAIILFLIAGLFILALPVLIAILIVVLISRLIKGMVKN
jgi:hypothetical protein